jgi:hypothetical protein
LGEEKKEWDMLVERDGTILWGKEMLCHGWAGICRAIVGGEIEDQKTRYSRVKCCSKEQTG